MFQLAPTRQIALQIGQFQIHWYGIMYLLAFLLAYLLLPRLQWFRRLTLSQDDWGSILAHAVIGVIVGGRLGYVLFYDPQFFAEHPLEVFAVWKGGMSSHGGFIGVTLMLALVCWRKRYDIRRIADVAVVPIALGLALGRIGNFINQELYGTVTTVPWAIAIPGVPGLRHPTQIYAVFKDVTIALLCYFHLRYGRSVNPGRTTALFLMLYGVLRFIVEYYRAQDYPPTVILGWVLTRGQLLTIPIFLFGAFLWVALRDRSAEEE